MTTVMATANWQSWDEFFRMGGYALYVWGSYGVTLLALLADGWAARRRRLQARAALPAPVAAARAPRIRAGA